MASPPRNKAMRLTASSFSPVALQVTKTSFVVHAIADGETITRCWNPDYMHGSKQAAINHATPAFPCVHRIRPADPTNHRIVGKPLWVTAPPKKDFARYAIDYRVSESSLVRVREAQGG